MSRYAHSVFAIAFLAFSLSTPLAAPSQDRPAGTSKRTPATYPALPSEIPDKFEPATAEHDFVRRVEMISMRDGVKLHTVILVPKGAKNAPMLLTRTPYDADSLTSNARSAYLGSVLQGYDNPADIVVESGYIRVMQDVRGKYGSEGDYVMNRPPRGPQNPTPVDHSTDTYDTIEWLVKNVAETNGRVGIIGISYDGFLPLMALLNPHPALKVAVPMNPMVDGWLGDDWFHNGAFRQLGMPYFVDQESSAKGSTKWYTTHYDDYDTYLEAGSAGELARRRGVDQTGFWKKISAHPNYDAFWRDQAVDKILAAQPLRVPVMLVHGLWDQEDIYGAVAVYKALEPKDTRNDMVYLVMGPWRHGQQILDGSSLGAIQFGSDTAYYFRHTVLRPFLDRYLKENVATPEIAPVTAFETGTNRWLQLKEWPAGCAERCSITTTPLYLRGDAKLSFAGPSEEAAFTEYVSDPAKPVPFVTRPVYSDNRAWKAWLVSDQREFSGRTDVVTFTSDVLKAPMKISGEPVASLVASTSGTDSDWVVKLIDVYPPEYPRQREMGGYQLMISGDIFRGRFRESFEKPAALTPHEPLRYRFPLPTADHVFLPGHRVMVQVQSTWFPLYDRNPQTFVPNIFFAKPDDYRKATQRIYHTHGSASFIELPVAEAAER